VLSAERRAAAVRLLVGLAGGALPFLAWLPTFREQLAHTGTPWDDPVAPVAGFVRALAAVGGERGAARILFAVLVGAVLAVGVARRPVSPPSAVTVLAGLGVGTLALGILVSSVAGTGFQARYAAPAVPLLLLAAALAVAAFDDVRARGVVLAAFAVVGLVGGWQAVRASRTAATAVAAMLRPELGTGDVVAYCPDQLGPATFRLLGARVHQVRYPDLRSAASVDWRDYEARHAAASPRAFARSVDARTAGRVFLVWSGGYRTLGHSCEQVVNELADRRGGGVVLGTAAGPNGERAEVRRFGP
jgi:hypothetical protein